MDTEKPKLQGACVLDRQRVDHETKKCLKSHRGSAMPTGSLPYGFN